MDIARWTIAAVLLACSLFVAVGQFLAMAASSHRLRTNPDASGYSLVPLFGGILGTVGALIAPHATVQKLWWVPLLVDPGCALMFAFGAVFVAGELLRRFTDPPP